jgi:hypothetical protein
MHRHVAAIFVAAATLAAAGSLPAQAIQGPTYQTFLGQAAAPITLTSWTASAGIGGIDTPLYYHWFTGTITLPAPNFAIQPGDYFAQSTSGQIVYSPLYPPDPTSPYTGCAACIFPYSAQARDVFGSSSGALGRGSVFVLSTEATMGGIATTYAGFLVPTVQVGTYNNEIFIAGQVRDRIVISERATFVLASPAPTVTPEPATWALLGGGLLAMGVVGRRRKGAA